MTFIRNLFAACCAISMLALSGQAAWPQSGRTIKLIVPVPPGASTDAVARLMAEQIGRAQGVTIVVENRPGASGMIGTEAVSRAAPDGNTLLMTANTYLIDAQTRKANYHPVTAFDPICYPGAVAGGVRGQQRVALPDLQGPARCGARQARRAVDGGGRPRHDVPDGLQHDHQGGRAST